jgi:hypothetical protein
MTMQWDETCRNAALDALETATGASPTLEIRTGPPPATCAAADTGTVLATMALPADFMNPASGGVKTKLGTWQDLLADASGTAGHYRIKQGANCRNQGTVALTTGGDLNLDSITFTAGQPVTITTFQWSIPA